MDISKLGRVSLACILLVTSQPFQGYAAEPQQTEEANAQFKAALRRLESISQYADMGDMPEVFKKIDDDNARLEKLSPSSAEYQATLDQLKSDVAGSNDKLNDFQNKFLADPSIEGMLKKFDLDSAALKQCAGVYQRQLSNPDLRNGKVRAYSDETERCDSLLKTANANVTNYIADQRKASEALKTQIAALQKQRDEATGAEKERLDKLVKQLTSKRDEIEKEIEQAEQTKRALSLLDVLSALAQLAVGVIGAAACVGSGQIEGCMAAVAGIKGAVDKLSNAQKTVEVPRKVRQPGSKEPETAAKENALKAAVEKKNVNTKEAEEVIKKDNRSVVPADSPTGLLIAQKIEGGHVTEISLVDATTKQAVISITDESLFTDANNPVKITRFTTFTRATTVIDKSNGFDDRLMELHGNTADGEKTLLLRIYPLLAKGRIVATGT
ncbi:hypothetical protein JQ554_28075 [Bradyrhizobium diazoefficiens]|nr:hypothetical protein [Bradyrhizobium diazoefficiens]MBR0967093.1 hypothetical protein [Bradyrhizobium diazoefficiens]MBR0979091.1 hypothetical protein [Bradyrhizobium diazoefficiens]MBR1010150.1 hypothetical protein [Bradyrhizobium diazoefficiens]MBR1017378.1 hypothetical protein [Bradyrhizobium diazoefficiens]MBR1054848.1 hypothetical protein [Bradyrhizobium diazoefficiens]